MIRSIDAHLALKKLRESVPEVYAPEQTAKQREVTTGYKKIYGMMETTEKTGKKKPDKKERED